VRGQWTGKRGRVETIDIVDRDERFEIETQKKIFSSFFIFHFHFHFDSLIVFVSSLLPPVIPVLLGNRRFQGTRTSSKKTQLGVQDEKNETFEQLSRKQEIARLVDIIPIKKHCRMVRLEVESEVVRAK
jgi:hypothetical protein